MDGGIRFTSYNVDSAKRINEEFGEDCLPALQILRTEWAKPLLLQKPEIAKNQVRAKIDEMLEKRKEAERQDDGL